MCHWSAKIRNLFYSSSSMRPSSAVQPLARRIPAVFLRVACDEGSCRCAAQYFYEEQLHRMECLSQEPVLFEDVLCQMHDMIQPRSEGFFALRDLKRNRHLAGTLFNILFNLNKFIAFETRDPFLVRQARLTQPCFQYDL